LPFFFAPNKFSDFLIFHAPTIRFFATFFNIKFDTPAILIYTALGS